MPVALALACLIAAGCGRVGFESERAGADAPSEGVTDAATDASDAAVDGPRAPLTLDPGFPIVIDLDVVAGTTITSPTFTTPGPDRLVVGVFVWGTGGTDESPLTLTGAGLSWTQRVLTTFLPGSVPPGTSGDAIWTAWAAQPVTGQVTAARSSTTENAVLTLAVYSFANAAQTPGATGTHTDQTTNTPLLADITTTAAGSWVIGGFHHGTANAVRTPTPDTVWDVTDDPSKAPNGHFHAIGRYRGVTIAPGKVTIGSADPGPYSLVSLLEILQR